MIKNCLLFIGIILSLLISFSTRIHADFSLTGSNTFNGAASTAIPITDLQITGAGSEPIPVKLYVTSGTLAMSTTTGLTFDGATSGSEIYFSGSLANINNALASLTYTRGSIGTDTLEVSLVSRGEVFFTDNNHLYKFITGNITANDARTAATSQTAYGAAGYLATITSQEENDFVAARLEGDGWMGAGDIDVEGDWKWLTGPEAGTSFWSGAAAGSAVNGNYENWSSGEPNNWAGSEDCGQFYITSGMWNDLPCTNTLSGYVVEFGAPDDLPTVTAKDITINTIAQTTASSFTPADNATGIALEANLTIQFNKTVTVDTGNILLRLSSDDSLIETIDVTDAKVTGSGTNTITINPDTTLSENTGYYLTIPNTAFHDTYDIYYAGLSSTTAWNFTTGDFTDPSINTISATPTSTGVTITWNTTENASTQVSYGLTNSYGTTTAETDTSPRVSSHSATLSSLLSCTTYHYRVTSTDGSSNTTNSSDQTFNTAGCQSDATPVNTTSNSITSNTGGTTTLTENSTQISVETPEDFTDESATVIIQIKALPKAPILQSLGRPNNLPNEVGNIVFDVKAIINGSTVLDSFDAPVTISYQYTDADIAGLDESSIWLYHYTGGAWEALDGCNRNFTTNSITCTTDSFSIFGLFGNPQSNSGSSDSSPDNSPSAPSCQATAPSGIPDLFQIDVSDNQARLYFSPITDHVTNYLVVYGYTPGEERFSTFTDHGASTGVLSYTINHLDRNMPYYFRVQPFNDCIAGESSNEMKATTISRSVGGKTYYKNLLSRVLSAFPKQIVSLGSSNVNMPTTTVQTSESACNYVVTHGDSLWKIALEKLGSGSKYPEIVRKNNLSSEKLSIGQILKVGC